MSRIPYLSTQLNLAPAAYQTAVRADEIARSRNHERTNSAHLVLAMLEPLPRNERIHQLLQISGVSVEEAKTYVESYVETTMDPAWRKGLCKDLEKLFELATNEAWRYRGTTIEVEHYFIAATRHQRRLHVGEVLRPLGLEAPRLREQFRGLQRKDHSKNPLDLLSNSSVQAIEAAHEAMRTSFCGRISTAHLLLGILNSASDSLLVETVRSAGIDIEKLRAEVKAAITGDGKVAATQKQFTSASKRALERAARMAKKGKLPLIDPSHLLLALLPRWATWREILAYGVRVDDPLETVWESFPTATLELKLRAQTDAFVAFQKRPPKLTEIPPTIRTEKILKLAEAAMRATSCAEISTAHLTLALIRDKDGMARDVLEEVGLDLSVLENSIRQSIAPSAKLSEKLPKREAPYSLGAERALNVARHIASHRKFRFMDSSHLLYGLVMHERILDAVGTDPKIWSAEQVAAILDRLKPPPYNPSTLNPSTRTMEGSTPIRVVLPADRTRQRISWGSFAFGVVGSQALALLSTRSILGAIAGLGFVAAIFISGIGCGIAILTNRTPRTKELWTATFIGLVGGMMIGFYLHH